MLDFQTFNIWIFLDFHTFQTFQILARAYSLKTLKHLPSYILEKQEQQENTKMYKRKQLERARKKSYQI